MDRSELLEVASQYLDRVIILLTVAGEERLALDIEEWMDGLDFSGLPPDAKPTPAHISLISSGADPIARQDRLAFSASQFPCIRLG